MAKQSKCDRCGKEGRLGTMGEAPAGWVEAIERRPSMEYNKDFLACSPLCMGGLMADRAAELHPPVDEEPARRG